MTAFDNIPDYGDQVDPGAVLMLSREDGWAQTMSCVVRQQLRKRTGSMTIKWFDRECMQAI